MTLVVDTPTFASSLPSLSIGMRRSASIFPDLGLLQQTKST
jgi:hypothetical protein